MIDLGLLRTDPEGVTGLVQRKDPSYNVQLLIDLDREVRQVRLDLEALRHKKNELAQQGKSGVTPEIREQSILISKSIKEKEERLAVVEKDFKTLYLTCPNLPQTDIPLGGKEANKVVKTVGQKPTFTFPIKHHVELGNHLGWFDFERASLITGSNFPLYKGDAVRLIYALTMFMLKNNMRHNFELALPVALVNEKSLETTGNFPKFRDQAYAVPADELYLSPTAEVGLTNMYRDHIFMADQLPQRMTAWTSCFRREAGSYGATERGLIRIHQFEKVELVSMCEPQDSAQELERMVACAESILQQLGLHYRVSLLAAQDCSFQSAKTYDIEVWLPGQNAYYEVSSASNCTDFQARRGMIRYKKTADSKTELVHTLNASSLAVPRLMAALMETYQQEDGSIALPEILKQAALFV